MSSKRIIAIENLDKTFGGVRALRKMNFSVYEDEIRCLAGENGCGKSTLIKIISGFYQPDSGTMSVFGNPITHQTPENAINSGIQVIYQDFALFPNMTVAENIMMYQTVGRRQFRYRIPDTIINAQQIVQRIHFDIDVSKYVYQLSVAEKQMVAICRALVVDPNLLIMDEPTTALTKREVEKLFEIVRLLKQDGVSTLFVSHKLDEIYEVCDCVTVMRNGKNVFETGKGESLPDKDRIVYYMTGHRVSDSHYEYQPSSSVPVMEVKNYSLAGSFSAVNFRLFPGEVLGITGLLGCGRSELAESLFGILPADSGSILLDGTSCGIISDVTTAMKNHISYVPDDRLSKGLHLDQSIGDNSITCIVDHLVSVPGVIDLGKVDSFKERAFKEIPIPNLQLGNSVKSLSGGNQQKVVLIKWLASNPRILILNCPTVGVDIGAKSEILHLVVSLAQEKRIGVIVISDDIYEILQVCNRILIMNRGQITGELPIEDADSEKLDMLINGTAAEKVRI